MRYWWCHPLPSIWCWILPRPALMRTCSLRSQENLFFSFWSCVSCCTRWILLCADSFLCTCPMSTWDGLQHLASRLNCWGQYFIRLLKVWNFFLFYSFSFSMQFSSHQYILLLLLCIGILLYSYTCAGSGSRDITFLQPSNTWLHDNARNIRTTAHRGRIRVFCTSANHAVAIEEQ